jgi:hypothetical protein
MRLLEYLLRYIVIIGLYVFIWNIVQTIRKDFKDACSTDAGGHRTRQLVQLDFESDEDEERRVHSFESRVSVGLTQEGIVAVDSFNDVCEQYSVVFSRGDKCFVYSRQNTGSTYLNGEKVNRCMQIRPGDILEVCGIIYEYRE